MFLDVPTRSLADVEAEEAERIRRIQQDDKPYPYPKIGGTLPNLYWHNAFPGQKFTARQLAAKFNVHLKHAQRSLSPSMKRHLGGYVWRVVK